MGLKKRRMKKKKKKGNNWDKKKNNDLILETLGIPTPGHRGKKSEKRLATRWSASVKLQYNMTEHS
jgi:hypothetical protein